MQPDGIGPNEFCIRGKPKNTNRNFVKLDITPIDKTTYYPNRWFYLIPNVFVYLLFINNDILISYLGQM